MLSIFKKSVFVGQIVKPLINGKSFIRSIRLNSDIASKNQQKSVANISTSFTVDLEELKNQQKECVRFLPEVVCCLNEYVQHEKLKDVATHFAKALDYNLIGGKYIRIIMTVDVYKNLISIEQQTSENLRLANLLGWCHELLIQAIVISDDIMDNGEFRRGKPTWHRLKDVKKIAINDVLMIENGCYMALKRFFGHLSCYTNLFEQFHETAYDTAIGQSLDFLLSKSGVGNFSLDTYNCLTYYKSDPISFYAPFVLPMILAGYNDKKLFHDIRQISHKISTFFQARNDFYDRFNDKKSGNDIQEGKCTWLSATAMEYGTDKQKDVMQRCYGKNDIECVNQIQQVYSEMDMPGRYVQFEKETYNDIKLHIDQFGQSNDPIHKAFMKQFEIHFNRDIYVNN